MKYFIRTLMNGIYIETAKKIDKLEMLMEYKQ